MIVGLGGRRPVGPGRKIQDDAVLPASGGILCLIFRDNVPQDRLENRNAPPFDAMIGFMPEALAV